MRRIVLGLFVLLAGCSTATTDGPVRRPVDPPVVVVDPPAPGGPTTTAQPDIEFSPVDILTAPAPTQDGMDALGTFVLKYDTELNCLYHLEGDNNGEPGTGGRVVVQWPFGYSASNQNGKVIVFDETGTAVATSGVQFQIAGGGGVFDGAEVSGGCDAIGIWYANGGPMPPGG